jgi:hypothetical protein
MVPASSVERNSMFDSDTAIAIDGGQIQLSKLVEKNAVEHVIVRPIGVDGNPREYEFRHNKVVSNEAQTGMGTTIVVGLNEETYTLTCSRRTRIWLETPKEGWVAATEIQVGDNIAIFTGFDEKTNGVGSVVSVTDIDTMTGQQIAIENETDRLLSIYASCMLVSIPY